MKHDLKIAWLQADLIWEDAQANRNSFEKKISFIERDCDLIVLPETFNTGFPVDPKIFAESINGETLNWMQQMAQRTGAVITGSLLIESNGNFSNSLIWMRPDGSFERYDKRHVFSMGGENERIKAGENHLFVELNGWKIKPMICYDLRFPVWSKNKYAGETFNYDLAVYVANWPAVRSYPWRQLLIARAIENIACVVGINRVGVDGPGNAYSGNSMFIDAKGSVLEEASGGIEKAISVNLSAEEILDFRKKFNVGLDWDGFEIKQE